MTLLHLLALGAFVLGLIVGSFLNVVIHRVPLEESVVTPRSRCPGCRRTIAAWDNVPVLSYLILRGRCRHCGRGISARYPLVELATGLLFATLALRLGPTPLLPVWLVIAAILVAAALIDFDHQFIPDGLSLGGALFALAAVPAATALAGAPYLAALADSLLGAAIGAGFLWIVGFGHARVSAAMGRRFPHWPDEGEDFPVLGSVDYWTWFPGLGFGDVKLMALVGAGVGPAGVVLTIIGAALVGLVWGGVAAVMRRAADVPFGFGPAIVLAALAVVLAPPVWFVGLLP